MKRIKRCWRFLSLVSSGKYFHLFLLNSQITFSSRTETLLQVLTSTLNIVRMAHTCCKMDVKFHENTIRESLSYHDVYNAFNARLMKRKITLRTFFFFMQGLNKFPYGHSTEFLAKMLISFILCRKYTHQHTYVLK